MESSPLNSETEDSEDKVSGKKKKKTAALGGVAVEPKTTEDLWAKLGLIKRKGGVSEAAVPLAELDPARTPEADEAEAPLESLGPDEEQLAVREIVAAQQQAEAEQPDESPEGAAEAAVDSFRDKIAVEGQSPARAFAETLDSLGAAPEEEPEPVTEDNLAEQGQAEPSNLRNEVEQSMPDPEIFIAESAAEDTAGSGGALPPAPPRPAAVPGGERPSPAAWLPRSVPERSERQHNADVVGAAFLGGIVGYLIGRRRGRIKTRKKLLPIQKKLEKQVGQLQEDIQRKEFYIRKAASAQTLDRQKIFQMEQANKKTEAGRPVAMEANQLHGKVAPERIGRVLITADEAPKTETVKEPEPRESLAGDKKVTTLSRSELLELSGRVKVENTNLRRVYETHLVSEQGLRRLVNEYLRGADVQKALRSELVEHEIDFERDPVLRDHGRTEPPAATPAGQGSPTLSGLLRKAGVAEDDHEAKFTAHAKKLYSQDKPADPLRHLRFVDISLVVIIFILLLLVLTLAMSRQ